jgi:hypothetical protein
VLKRLGCGDARRPAGRDAADLDRSLQVTQPP